jgi:hypothetical protein
VTGEGSDGGTSCDYITIKYYPNGDTAWIQRYAGTLNSSDIPLDVAVDNYSNVYVTGGSQDSVTGMDFTTVKYDSNGTQLWAQRYNGWLQFYDFAVALAVDGLGNVCVTGHTRGEWPPYFDYATVKYDSNGTQLWAKGYGDPEGRDDVSSDIAIDGSGNVYVTGRSTGIVTGVDYATIKYYPNGDTAWIRKYNGPGTYQEVYDEATAIAVDGSNNIYVTGRSGTYVSETRFDYATVKYDSDGNQLWVQRYNGPANLDDEARAIAVDGFNNVYVTGRSFTGTDFDYATVKYDSDGTQLWAQRYNGPANSDDEAVAIAVDGSGNAYVTGYSGGIYYDYATVKYDSDGNQLWVQRYNGPANLSDNASAIAVDNSNSVYVTGASASVGPNYDYVTIKYIQFLRADANGDSTVSVSDVIYLINYLFKGGLEPVQAPIVADSNCDGSVTISDVVYLINYLFKGGPPPGC